MRTNTMHILRACGCLLVFLFIANSVRAQEISINSWDFSGTTGDQASSISGGINTNFLSASLSRGTGLVAAADADSFNSSGWSTSADYDTANTAGDYLTFTVTPKTSVKYTITKLVLKFVAPSTFSPDKFSLRASTDNFKSNISTFALDTLPASAQITLYLDTDTQSMLRNLTAPVTFRFFGVRALFASSTFKLEGTGNDLEVFGTVVPTVALALTNSPLAEAGGVATVSAVLSSVSTNPVTVGLAFSGVTAPVPLGTATLNTDYSRSSNNIVIPPGSLTGSVTLTSIDDLQDEYEEDIRVDISSVVNGTELNGSQWVHAHITDDDYTGVSLSLTGSPIAEAGGVAIVTATLSGISPSFVQVNLNVNGDMGTATRTNDYVRSSDVISILAGSLTGSVTLTAVQDALSEPAETIKVTIASVIYGTIAAPSTVEAVITDDDATPEMDVRGNSVSIVDGDAAPSLTDHTDFGSALVTGGTVVRTYTITNSGYATLNLTNSPIVVASGDFTVSSQPAATVAAGGTTTFQVTFDPTTPGLRSGTLSIANNDAGKNPYNFSIQGTGTAKIIGVSGNLAFGNVTTGTTSTAALTLTNSGNTTLTVSGIGYPARFSGAWNGTIAAGKSTNVTVTFAPLLVQAYSGTITVTNDGAGGNTIEASGTGVAVATRIIGVSGSLAFGSVTTGTTSTAALTITNSGNATLTVSGITYPTKFTGAWSGTIAAGQSTNVTVTFAPVALAAYGGTVTVNSDKTSGGNTIGCSGTGTVVVTKIIGLSGNLAFGSVMTGTTVTAALTITNSGNTTLAVSGIGYPARFSGAWNGTIAAGKSTNVTVTFAPLLVQAYSGTITVTNDGTGGNTIGCSGTGADTFVVTKPTAGASVAVWAGMEISWAGLWPLGSVDIDLWQGSNFVAGLATNLPAPNSNMSWRAALPLGVMPGSNYWVSVIDSDTPEDFADSGLFSLLSVAMLQQGDGGAAGLWTLGLNGKPMLWTSVTAAKPGWIMRDIDGNRVLLQQGNGGQAGIWTLGPDGKPLTYKNVCAAKPGWILRSLDGNKVLLQNGNGGQAGIWTLDTNGVPTAYAKVTDSKPGWILRSLNDCRVLLQQGDGGQAGIWTLSPSGMIVSWKPIRYNMSGLILRSLDGDRVMVQVGNGGMAGTWQLQEMSDHWLPVSWTGMSSPMPGWIIRAMD